MRQVGRSALAGESERLCVVLSGTSWRGRLFYPSDCMQHEPPITCCAVIPARGGSKGIPGKNLKRIAGQPLVALSIQAAKRAKHVQRVVVSTDDPAIAEVARAHGAEV